MRSTPASRRQISAAVALLSLLPGALSAGGVPKEQALYVGGTIASVPEAALGALDLQGEEELVFTWDRSGGKKTAPGSFQIAYDKVTSLEYGQKAGRRVGVAILVTPWALFSKKRRHFLTIGFTDAGGKAQAAVMELGKEIVKTTLTILETRSGKKVEYESDEARKHVHG